MEKKENGKGKLLLSSAKMLKCKDKEELNYPRVYHCVCGNKMDRDRNAAINIREEGKKDVDNIKPSVSDKAINKKICLHPAKESRTRG